MNTEWKPIARWYAVDKHGAATLCTCEEDARETAAESDRLYPHLAPYTAVQLAPVSAPTSHPIPTGATGDRDWELACDNCNGSGHVFVERQVAERKTDVQEFKEECEACEGRGFNIAFEDIPGISKYVKSCRPATTVAAGAANDGRQAFAKWFDRRGVWPALCYEEVFIAGWNARPVAAPAAGDALEVLTDDEILHRWDTHVGDSPITESDKLCFAREIESDLLSKLSKRDAKDAARYRWWCDTGNDIASADTIGGKPTIDAAIDAAIAQQSQRKEA